MADAECNGVRLYFETLGEGEPVLVIGGTSMPPVLFQLSLAPALVDAGYQAVLFASRGVEPSEAPPAPYTVAEMAADAAGLIEHLGIGPCRVVGYSLGGFIAEELCYQRPDLVRDIVLMASAGRSTSFLRTYVQAEVDMAEAVDPPLVNQTGPRLAASRPTDFRAAARRRHRRSHGHDAGSGAAMDESGASRAMERRSLVAQ